VEVLGQNAGGADVAIGKDLRGKRALREWSRRLPFRPTLRFLYSYVFKRGFLDGAEGYMFCRMLATYEMLNVFKVRELRRRKSGLTL